MRNVPMVVGSPERARFQKRVRHRDSVFVGQLSGNDSPVITGFNRTNGRKRTSVYQYQGHIRRRGRRTSLPTGGPLTPQSPARSDASLFCDVDCDVTLLLMTECDTVR